MRIALIAPVALSVPPVAYGGTERVVANLADGLVARGHAVTLFASGDARTRATLRACYPRALERGGALPRARYDALEHAHVSWALSQAAAFDVVHDHTKHWGVELAGGAGTPVLTTVHNDVTPARRAAYAAYPGHGYVAISQAHAARLAGLRVLGVVYNGLELAQAPYQARKDDYYLFMGRLDAAKGADLAARLAARYDMPLVMAGRIDRERGFFEAEVAPWLDGRRRRYVGEVSGAAKWALYAGARALLFPIQWEEPFGLVVIEAMACGTPVVATRRGSAPELVEPGVGGVLAAGDDLESLHAATLAAADVDPAGCRALVARRFSAERMIEAYEALYARLAAGKAPQCGLPGLRGVSR